MVHCHQNRMSDQKRAPLGTALQSHLESNLRNHVSCYFPRSRSATSYLPQYLFSFLSNDFTYYGKKESYSRLSSGVTACGLKRFLVLGNEPSVPSAREVS